MFTGLVEEKGVVTAIVAVAQERLGMVSPPGVTYLSPSGPVTGWSNTSFFAMNRASRFEARAP